MMDDSSTVCKCINERCTKLHTDDFTRKEVSNIMLHARKFKKKPIVIEAIQYQREENIMAVQDFFGDGNGREFIYIAESNEYGIKTLEGVMVVNEGDWIIRGVKGEYYPCKADIFEATYEAV